MMRSLDEDFAYEQLRQKRIDNMKTNEEYRLLEQQLANCEKQIVMLRGFVKLLRDYIPASAIGNMTVQDALDATTDLDGMVVCDAVPVGIVDGDYGTGKFLYFYVAVDNETLLYQAKEKP